MGGEILANHNIFEINLCRPRRRYCQRPSIMSDTIQKFSENMNNNQSSNSLHGSTYSGEGKRPPKRDSRHTISDDEPTTDWTPEIPFWNVISLILFTYSTK